MFVGHPEIFIEQNIDLSYFSKLFVSVHFEAAILTVQLLACIEALKNRVKEAGIAKILEPKNL